MAEHYLIRCLVSRLMSRLETLDFRGETDGSGGGIRPPSGPKVYDAQVRVSTPLTTSLRCPRPVGSHAPGSSLGRYCCSSSALRCWPDCIPGLPHVKHAGVRCRRWALASSVSSMPSASSLALCSARGLAIPCCRFCSRIAARIPSNRLLRLPDWKQPA